MKNLLLTGLHLAVATAKLCGPGGVQAVIAENLLLKQQLIVLRRARQRAPNLTLSDRLICGLGSLFVGIGRIRKVAVANTFGVDIGKDVVYRVLSKTLSPRRIAERTFENTQRSPEPLRSTQSADYQVM
jgi:hypothetical protein